MTLILGISDPANERAIVCSDSAQWRGDLVAVTTRGKLWGGGGWVAGLSGQAWQADLLRNVAFPRKVTDTAVDTYARRLLIALGRRQGELAEITRENPDPCSLVVAADSSVYHLGSDFGVGRPVHGVVASGCGYEFAVGCALGLIPRAGSMLTVAETVMRLAREHTHGCVGPLRWLTTDGEGGTWE